MSSIPDFGLGIGMKSIIDRNPQSKGFTLLEVLLAVAILAFIVSTIYASFFTAGRNVEQAEAIRDSTDLARTLTAKLSEDVHNAFCAPGMNAGFFYGKNEEVETAGGRVRHDSLFLTTLTNWRRPNSKETDLWEVGYFFKQKPDGAGYVLFRSEKRELSKDASPLEGGTEYELTDRVKELRFRYYDGSKWAETWDKKTGCTQAGLPRAVEILLSLEDGNLYTTRVDVGNAAQ